MVTRIFRQALLLLLLTPPLLADEVHWSFRRVERPVPPRIVRQPEPDSAPSVTIPRNPIDPFILQKLNVEGISPAIQASGLTYLRRVTLDLTGLPPTPEELDDFLRDSSPDASDRLVDRLLASPRYGERWARPWLDLCHYGDSDGHLTDQLRPVAWRYRDWVVRMLNENLSFDEFTVRQLAGDLLHPSNGSVIREADQDQILGTGFLRQTLSNREGGADLEEYRVAQLVDRTSMVGTAWLGLTVGCARCHDHKYDPLTQAEFFQLYSFFDNANEVNIDAPLPQEANDYPSSRAEYERRREELLEPYRERLMPLLQRWEAKCLHAEANPGEDHVWDRQWELLGLIWGGNLGEGQLEGCEIIRMPWKERSRRQQADLLDYFLARGSVTDEKQFAELKLADLQKQLTDLKKSHPAAFVTRAPVIQTAFHKRQTYIHDRGDFRSRGPEVASATPPWLTQASPRVEAKSRLDMARWLTSRDNPLTARVTVNRMWQEFFGKGLVATSDDWGTRGDPPSHPELLDWLAAELMESAAWDVKRMHRRIVESATYRQSSAPRDELAMLDPGNRLLARQSSLRIPAEAVRDSALSVSGLLSTRLGGPSVFPPQHERVTMEAFGSNVWKPSLGEDRYRRGLYTFLQRTSPFAQAIIFDAPVPLEVCARRDRSNSPLQALTLLNDPAFAEMAAALGDRIQRESGPSDQDRIQYAIRICLSRPAEQNEVDRLMEYLASMSGKSDSVRWSSLGGVLLNLHEFITRD